MDDFASMTDKELQEYMRLALQNIDAEDDSDYEVNKPRWTDLVRVLTYLTALANKQNGRVEKCELIPKYRNGGVTAYFTVLDLDCDEVKRFCSILSTTSAITMDTTLDHEVCISVSVPDVFVKRK